MTGIIVTSTQLRALTSNMVLLKAEKRIIGKPNEIYSGL
jgi:hypothetical protein